MSDWQQFQPYNLNTVSSMSIESVGLQAFAQNALFIQSLTYTATNLAIYIPFLIYQPCTAFQMFTQNGASVAGNVDVGIYDEQKHRLVSSGSTAQAGVSVIQAFNITDTLLNPGLYYMAMAADGTSGLYIAGAPAKYVAGSWGVLQQGTAFPLPSTATWVSMNNAWVPNMGVSLRSLV